MYELPSQLYFITFNVRLETLLSLSFLEPKSPSNVSITHGSDRQSELRVTWSLASSNAASVTYRIRLDRNGSAGAVMSISHSTTSQVFSNLTPSQKYSAVMWAIAADGTTGQQTRSADIFTCNYSALILLSTMCSIKLFSFSNKISHKNILHEKSNIVLFKCSYLIYGHL